MSILSGIFGNTNITDNSMSVNKTGDVQSSRGSSEVSTGSLTPGQTISGKIISNDKNGVRIQLDQGGTMNAKLDSSAELRPGQSVTFSVASNQGSQITLSPLYTNLASDATASKALQNAGIPITDTSVQMTNSMMKEGMNIDASSLLNMYQKVSSFPGENVNSIVMMNRYGLEINSDNLEKFQAFQNYEQQITSGMNDIMEGANSVYMDLISSGEDSQAANFVNTLIDTFLPQDADGNAVGSGIGSMQGNMAADGTLISGSDTNSSGNVANISDNNTNVPNGTLQMSDGNVPGNSTMQNLGKVIISENQSRITGASVTDGTPGMNMAAMNTQQGQGVNGTGADAVNLVNADGGQAVNSQTASLNPLDASAQAGTMTEGQLTQEQIAQTENDAWKQLPMGTKAVLLDSLRQSGMSQTEESALLEDGATTEDFLKTAQNLLRKNGFTDGLKDLFGSKNFQNIMKNQMEKSWMLEPSEVGNKQTVENLYQRLNEQVKNLTENLSELAKPDSMMGQSLANMNQNLDFMNEMNQVYQYVQLPLKMNGTDTTGDLFVYTDKKSLAEKNGSVSALLHLDMQNLGPLDVYTSIAGDNKVATKFYLQDEDTIDFIAQNIHILDERLEKRGYSMRSEVVLRDSVTKNGENQTASGGMANSFGEDNMAAKKLAHYSFDAKA